MQSSRLAVLDSRIPGIVIGLLCAFGSIPGDADATPRNQTAQWAASTLQSLDNNPKLMAGQAAQKMASAKIDTARQPIYNPQLGLEWKRRGAQSAGSNFEIFVAQQIDVAGKRDVRSRQLESESQAIQEDYRLTRQDLLQAVLNSLADKWITAKLLEIAKQREGRATEFVRVLEKHQKTGRFAAYEVDNGYLTLAEAVRMVSDAEEFYLQSTFQLAELIGDSSIPNHLPVEVLSSISPVGNVENKVINLASVAAARWRFESSRAALDAVGAERMSDPTIGLIGGKDENDNFIGVYMAIPLALRSSTEPFRQVSSQAALVDEQRYRESFRRAEIRLKNAGAVYRSLFDRWKQWRSLTSTRIDNKTPVLHRLWDAGEISSVDYLAMLNDREDARISGIRMSGRVWKAWIEWLASSGELEPWLRNLAGYGNPDLKQ